MYNNIYEAIISISKFKADLFFEKLNELLPEVFTPLEETPAIQTPEERQTIILYIAHAYSLQSSMVIAGISDIKNKTAIADMVQLPDYLRGPVLMLSNFQVRNTIIKYLDAQKERDWYHLNIKKMQYDHLMSQSILTSTDTEGKTDYKFILQCSTAADDLFEQIQTIEEKLRNKYKKTDAAMEEVVKAADKFEKQNDNDSLSIESVVRPNVK